MPDFALRLTLAAGQMVNYHERFCRTLDMLGLFDKVAALCGRRAPRKSIVGGVFLRSLIKGLKQCVRATQCSLIETALNKVEQGK